MSGNKTNNDSSGDKVSILVVDDRADKLLAYEVMLGDLKQNIVCVRSGKEALRQLLQKDFAAILFDVNMPGMDGFETAALILQRQRCEATPIIFVSAINDTVNHISRGYSLGAVDYILTPIVPEILRTKIAAETCSWQQGSGDAGDFDSSRGKRCVDSWKNPKDLIEARDLEGQSHRFLQTGQREFPAVPLNV